MIKQGLLAATLLASTSMVYAHADFYVGLGASSDTSYLDNHSNRTNLRQITTINPRSITDDFSDYGTTGWNGELLSGVGYTFTNNIYLGAKAFAQISTSKGYEDQGSFTDFFVPDIASLDTSTFDTMSFRIPYSLGITFTPGYQVAPGSLLYGSIGYVNTKFKFNFNQTTTPNSFPDNTGLTHIDKNLSGTQAGFGVDTQVSNNLSIEEGYNWNFYNNFSTSATSLVQPFSTTYTARTAFAERTKSIHPTIEQFTLAVLYHFAATPVDSPTPNDDSSNLRGNQIYFGVLGSRDNIDYQPTASFYSVKPDIDGPGTDTEYSSQSNSFDLDGRGWNGQLALGDGYTFANNYYIAVEGFAGLVSAKANELFISVRPPFQDSTTISGSYKLNNKLGVALIPGYRVSPHALLYIRGGYVNSQIKVNRTIVFTSNVNPALNATTTQSLSSRDGGVEVGVGVETGLSKHVSLRTEWDYDDYNRISNPVTTNIPVDGNAPGGGVSTSVIEVKPIARQFMVGLIFRS